MGLLALAMLFCSFSIGSLAFDKAQSIRIRRWSVLCGALALFIAGALLFRSQLGSAILTALMIGFAIVVVGGLALAKYYDNLAGSPSHGDDVTPNSDPSRVSVSGGQM
jgi:uncharacterized membrane protein HdeD (DUF308 family)